MPQEKDSYISNTHLAKLADQGLVFMLPDHVMPHQQGDESEESAAVEEKVTPSQPARTMQRQEFSEAMGSDSSAPGRSSGPRTRQMAKRQRLRAQLR